MLKSRKTKATIVGILYRARKPKDKKAKTHVIRLKVLYYFSFIQKILVA